MLCKARIHIIRILNINFTIAKLVTVAKYKFISISESLQFLFNNPYESVLALDIILTVNKINKLFPKLSTNKD